MRDRLVLVPDQPRQRTKEVAIVDHHFMGVGANGRGHFARISKFVERALLEADRKRLDRPVDHAGHQRTDGAAVDSARQEHAERNVAHQPQAHRLFEQRPEPIHERGPAQLLIFKF